MYICIYVCVYMCLSLSLYIYIYLHIHKLATHVCVNTTAYQQRRTACGSSRWTRRWSTGGKARNIHVCMYTYIYIYIYTYTYIYVYIYI